MPPGTKPAPPGQAKRPKAATHQWMHADGTGWKGRKPQVPSGMTDAGNDAWKAWFGSWWAGFWCAEDLPALRSLVRLFDGASQGHVDWSKVTPLLDRYGITPKGRQDLRWAPPEPEADEKPAASDELQEKRAERAKRVS